MATESTPERKPIASPLALSPGPAPSARDWAGMSFEVIAAEGDDTSIRFGRVTGAAGGHRVTAGAARPGSGASDRVPMVTSGATAGPAPTPSEGDEDLGAPRVTWHLVPHASHDGVGGLARLLRERGQAPALLPALLRPKRPGPLARLKLAFVDVSGNRQPVIPWRRFDPTRRSAGPRTSLAWTTLDASGTADLVAHASVRGASVNSLLLWALDQAVRAHVLSAAQAPGLWMVPVNLRGGVTRDDDTQNCSSYLPVSLTGEQDPAAVHSSVRALLGRGVHWAAWSTVSMGRWAGRMYRGLVRSYYERPAHPWLGAFSNLGEWPVRPGTPATSAPGDAPARDDDHACWVFAPPPMKTVPIAAGAISWHGRLGLMIQAHPSLGATDADVAAWLTAWLAAARS